MPVDTLPNLLALMYKTKVLTTEQFLVCKRELAPGLSDPRQLAKALVQRGWLTTYQVNEIFLGRSEQLLLGSFVLLEKLGEGGMGQVFRARNWKMNKIVALKLIRKEKLANETTLKRFHREIHAAAQLQHPNIVKALDADEVNGTHFFVMEYVEGKDLSQLVKEQGPLPVAAAADYIRQAALGLQHAFERGMVHRDIKPHNLLVAGAKSKVAVGKSGSDSALDPPVVKILDMGLARLDLASDSSDDQTSTMTQEGAVMGTPDYIAPEQSMDSHTVDIRADLYSLGCTLYFILAGRPPFTGGSLTEKLLKHQLNEAEPIQSIRQDVPDSLAWVLSRLMAKRPEQRFQSPAELAQALDQAMRDPLPSGAPLAAPVAAPQGDFSDFQDTPNPHLPTFDSGTSAVEELRKKEQRRKDLIKRWSLIGGAAALGLILLLVAIPLLRGRKQPDPPPDPGPGPTTKKPLEKTSDLTAATPVTEEWIKAVAQLTPTELANTVVKKLKALNPTWEEFHNIKSDKSGKIIGLTFKSKNLVDLSPLRGLPHLTELAYPAGGLGDGELMNLEPLTGMQLTTLNLAGHKVIDLKPLIGMPLKTLDLSNTRVANLAPLNNLPLETLNLQGSQVKSLGPLKKRSIKTLNISNTGVADLASLLGMPLETLTMNSSAVKDLAPLRKSPLKTLHCNSTKVEDFSPLADCPLETLHATGLKADISALKKLTIIKDLRITGTSIKDLEPLRELPVETLYVTVHPWRDLELLKALPKLKTLNGQACATALPDLDAKRDIFQSWAKVVTKMTIDEQLKTVNARIRELNSGYTGSLKHEEKDGKVSAILMSALGVEDLSPLRTFTHLYKLECTGAEKKVGRLKDLWALGELPLGELNLQFSGLADLTSLAGLPVTSLNCSHTPVADLSPLQGLPLTTLDCRATKVTDFSTLKNLAKLETLWCDLNLERDRAALEALTGLKMLNGKAPADVLKKE